MLFNEALSQATGTKDTVFIPIGWCTDMTGANMNGLERVYGKEILERVKSCEFHFKENRNKMAQKLKDNEEAQQFKELCDALLAARMVETYCSAKDSLESCIQNKPERSFLSSWVDWWHSRKQFIFRAFSPNEAAPRMNQAEVIHASWSHRHRSNLSRLDAAQADVRDSVMLEAELKAFKSGNTKGGSGPSYGERRKKSHQQEISRATQLGKEMSKLRGNLVDPSSGHRPPQEKAGKGKKGLVLFRNDPINQVLLGSCTPMLRKRTPANHSHIRFCHIPIPITRNSAQIHCSVTPTNRNNTPVRRNSAPIRRNSMLIYRNSMIMQLHSMLTHRSSTATHPTSTAIHPTSTAIHCK